MNVHIKEDDIADIILAALLSSKTIPASIGENGAEILLAGGKLPDEGTLYSVLGPCTRVRRMQLRIPCLMEKSEESKKED